MTSSRDGSTTQGSVLQFRTGAAMISRLGSEQLKDHFTAVIELVKNAYDADARVVTVELFEGEDGQRLRIQDDGSGMTLQELQTKWAYLATANKVREDRSPKYRRLRLGQKGVGRFATEKLGRKLVLRTHVEDDATIRQVRFDWNTLDADRELGEYTFPITRSKPENFEPPHGTRLGISMAFSKTPSLATRPTVLNSKSMLKARRESPFGIRVPLGGRSAYSRDRSLDRFAGFFAISARAFGR